jgi:hypothetical protein
VIWESSFWKDDLLEIAGRMERRRAQKRWPERSIVNVEKDAFLGFYVIRKLIDAKKLSTGVDTAKVKLTSYPHLGKPVTFMNWHRLDELYDFDRPRVEDRDLIFVCNQIVHSYVFGAVLGDEPSNGLYGVCFCSDRMRNSRLFDLECDEMIRVMRHVGTDYPDRSEMHFDEELGDWVVHQWQSRSGL